MKILTKIIELYLIGNYKNEIKNFIIGFAIQVFDLQICNLFQH